MAIFWMIQDQYFQKILFTVFNFEQVEWAPELDIYKGEIKFDPIQRCEDVLKNFDVMVMESRDTNVSFYSLGDDAILLPNRERFKNPLMFRTAFHEMVHATGAKTRLDRKLGSNDECDYAFEELVAEPKVSEAK